MSESAEKEEITINLNKVMKAAEEIAYKIFKVTYEYGLTTAERIIAVWIANEANTTSGMYKTGLLQAIIEELEENE